jgi:hypothetical protein
MSTYSVLRDKSSMYLVGLNLRDKYSYIAIGELIIESRLPTTKASPTQVPLYSALQDSYGCWQLVGSVFGGQVIGR